MRKYLDKTDINGTLVKESERYLLYDNTDLEDLIISKTILKPNQETTGHSHDNEEIYFFTQGTGCIMIDEETISVRKDSIILIPKNKFHKVENWAKENTLTFICVFPGKRDH